MIDFLKYIINYLFLNALCFFIPHPKLRACYLKVLGAKIGKNVRIENVKFIQVQFSVKNLQCADNVFIGTGVVIDLSSTITIGANSTIAPGCSLITHEDMGEFNENKLSQLYRKKYLSILIKENVFIGCDTTVLPGTTVDCLTVVGAKSLVKGHIPNKVLVAGIPAKVIKSLEIE